ncbi:MAG: 50S ribosomal protein L3 [Candidatus Bathyarchaeia archaeon]
MPKRHAPKRGSRAFSPRKRAKRIVGRIDYWPEVEEGPLLLGFAGYKAGMTHAFMVEDKDRSPDYGKEVFSPVTVLDTPPILICGIRAYIKTSDGLKPLTEAWMGDLPEDLNRVLSSLPEGGPEEALERISLNLDDIAEFRVIAATQPREAGVSKKKPELMEIKVGGGSKEEQLEYARSLLGKTIGVSDVFEPGEFVDIVGVTKGKGFQGPVKRWGIRIRSRKTRKRKREVASIGPWHPARVMPGVPRAGQMGFHHRTEYNKRILRMGSEGVEVTPPGGFQRYGVVKGDYVMLKGSVLGPQKRLIKLRKAARSPRGREAEPVITYVHTEFLRGGEDA